MRLPFIYRQMANIGKIKHIHRLDRDTTGAVLFAKHPFIGAILDHMLEKREIKRTYLAIVHGILKNKKGTIHEPIGRDRHHRYKKKSLTHWADMLLLITKY